MTCEALMTRPCPPASTLPAKARKFGPPRTHEQKEKYAIFTTSWILFQACSTDLKLGWTSKFSLGEHCSNLLQECLFWSGRRSFWSGRCWICFQKRQARLKEFPIQRKYCINLWVYKTPSASTSWASDHTAGLNYLHLMVTGVVVWSSKEGTSRKRREHLGILGDILLTATTITTAITSSQKRGGGSRREHEEGSNRAGKLECNEIMTHSHLSKGTLC